MAYGAETYGGQRGSELTRVVLGRAAVGASRGDVAVIGRPPVTAGQAVAARGTCPERAARVTLGYLGCDGSVTPRRGGANAFGCCEAVQLLGRVVALEREVEPLAD